MLRFDIASATGVQVVPPLAVYHTPPLTPPAHIRSGVVG